MKILVTGGKGMLGRTLVEEFSPDNEVVVFDLPEHDILDEKAFVRFASEGKFNVIVHTAAMTKVDDCQVKRDLAFALNGTGARNAALAAKACGARLFAISTDYVFSGRLEEGSAWGECDEPYPETVYGASKLAGEREVLSVWPQKSVILRIAWLYGALGPSFVHTMSALGVAQGGALKVVCDQRGNPTSTKVVASVIRFLLSKEDVSGIVHATCEGECSWYEFAKEIFSLQGLARKIVPCLTEEFPRPAPRPKNSCLKKDVLGLLGYRTPNWRVALSEFIRSEFATA